MKKITAIVLAVSLGACANVEMNREEMVGTAAGAALGGYLGYQFGGTFLMNSIFATAGTVAGGAVGLAATRGVMMGTDRAAYERTAQRGLTSAKKGQIVDWRNPDTGNSGIFRPTRSFYTAKGRLCRQYRTTVVFDKDVRSGVGMACLRADGSWQILSDDFS